MGDLGQDTEVVGGGEGRYGSALSEDWGIWGPNGGYVAAILLRAAGVHSAMARPASLAVHFLGRGAYEDVELCATTLRRTRRAEAVSVAMTQGDRPVAAALAWFRGRRSPGLEHDVVAPPQVPPPSSVRTWDERVVEAGMPEPPFRFWHNIEHRPLEWSSQWPPPGPLPPAAGTWFRFRPPATFDDRLVDAGRLVIVLDTMGWPAATRAHAWKWPIDHQPWVAPSLDLHVRFHRFSPDSEHLFGQVDAPMAGSGLIATEGRVWSADGTLLASGASQLLCTEVPPA